MVCKPPSNSWYQAAIRHLHMGELWGAGAHWWLEESMFCLQEVPVSIPGKIFVWYPSTPVRVSNTGLTHCKEASQVQCPVPTFGMDLYLTPSSSPYLPTSYLACNNEKGTEVQTVPQRTGRRLTANSRLFFFNSEWMWPESLMPKIGARSRAIVCGLVLWTKKGYQRGSSCQIRLSTNSIWLFLKNMMNCFITIQSRLLAVSISGKLEHEDPCSNYSTANLCSYHLQTHGLVFLSFK